VRKKIYLGAALALTGLGAAQAQAATITTTFNVTALVSSVCSIAATTLAFGGYNVFNPANLDAQSTVTAQCTSDTGYHIRMDKGLNGADITHRAMAAASSPPNLNYALYRDAAQTLNWGETDGVDTVDGTGNGLPQSYTVYGSIPALQNVNTGSYVDTITVTLTF
jgi:spore coat protein U-like protein